MKAKVFFKLGIVLMSFFTMLMFVSCGDQMSNESGIGKASVKINPGEDGLTVEQRNIKERLERDNTPGAIKHLYIISPYSGQVLLYSTVDGKVTSSGKRLAPYQGSGANGPFYVEINGNTVYTDELIQDDGTFGNSNPYIYWKDVRGVAHEHYFTGGQIIHVSDQPIAVKNIVLNLELVNSPPKEDKKK